jgi:hypothetical protein
MFKANGRFACMKCKATNNYFGAPEFALADLLKTSVREVKIKLYGLDGGKVDVHLDLRLNDFFDEDESLEEAPEEVREIPLVDFPHDYYPIDTTEAQKGAAYLESRGIPMRLAKYYGIRYAPLKKRVVFPVSDHGRLYGWQERLIIPDVFTDPDTGEQKRIPKILSSTGIPRDRTLMFVDRVRGQKHAVLTEGPIDAIKAHLCKGNVAAMGKAVTAAQMELLILAGVQKLYLALDPDAGEEMQRLHRDYFDFVEMYKMVAPIGGTKEKPDLGAMDYDEVYELFRGAEKVNAGMMFYFLNPKVAGL